MWVVRFMGSGMFRATLSSPSASRMVQVQNVSTVSYILLKVDAYIWTLGGFRSVWILLSEWNVWKCRRLPWNTGTVAPNDVHLLPIPSKHFIVRHTGVNVHTCVLFYSLQNFPCCKNYFLLIFILQLSREGLYIFLLIAVFSSFVEETRNTKDAWRYPIYLRNFPQRNVFVKGPEDSAPEMRNYLLMSCPERIRYGSHHIITPPLIVSLSYLPCYSGNTSYRIIHTTILRLLQFLRCDQHVKTMTILSIALTVYLHCALLGFKLHITVI